LSEFKGEAEAKIGDYKEALVLKMKDDLNLVALKQLQGIAGFEASMGSALQELIVREAASSFKEKFPSDAGMQKAAFDSAVTSLAGNQSENDPVAKHFEDAFASLGGLDKAKGDAKGSLAERVKFAQQAKEAEFKQTFMVTAEEAAAVKKVAGEAKSGDGFDFSKLSEASAQKLDSLYASINAKVGYSLPASLGSKAIDATSDSSTSGYVDSVNSQLSAVESQLKQARLQAFAKSFA